MNKLVHTASDFSVATEEEKPEKIVSPWPDLDKLSSQGIQKGELVVHYVKPRLQRSGFNLKLARDKLK